MSGFLLQCIVGCIFYSVGLIIPRKSPCIFLFSLFLFRIFPQNVIRGNATTNNTPNEGEKNHRGKVKEVETFQY
jgi:hypothetical protein